MFRITPKSLNAINVILAFVGKRFAVIQSVVFPQSFERVVALEGISVVDRSFSRVRFNVGHEFVSGDLLHDLGVDQSIPLKKAENNAFTGRATATLAFSPAAKICLINLNFAFQLATLEFCHMVDRFTQPLVDAGHTLVVDAQISGDTVRRLLLVEAGQDRNLTPQLSQRFLLPTRFLLAPNIATTGLRYSKRTAEYALSTPQKVGRTIENILFLHNQAIVYHVLGYESH